MYKKLLIIPICTLMLSSCVTLSGFPNWSIRNKVEKLYEHSGVCLARSTELQNYIVEHHPEIISRLVVGYFKIDRPHAWIEWQDKKGNWRLIEPTHHTTSSGFKIQHYKTWFDSVYDYNGIVYYTGIVDADVIQNEWTNDDFVHGKVYPSLYIKKQTLKEGESIIINKGGDTYE